MSVALKFEEINKSFMSECGGKGAMLGELTALAASLHTPIEVPEGFVFTTDLFGQWLTSAGVSDSNIAKALEKAGTDVKKLEEISNLLRERLSKVEIPGEAKDAIDSYITSGLYAVRSSGVGEDGSDSSFAGQHDSFLNTKTVDIASRVRDVWLSAFAPRALYYRVSKGLLDAPIRQAVVIQRMVAPDVAGVAFSVDPRTGNRNYGLVEYVEGLADKLVEGSVSPTSILFDKSAIKNAKHEAVEPVARTVCELEAILGYPVDMEWAWREGKLYLLQARPITALPEALDDAKVKGIILTHDKWGSPIHIGESFSGGEATALGYISRELANKILTTDDEELRKLNAIAYRILAVPFTTPDDLPIMEKVAGIIVSEGGVTSHAAIVCREMKKPCIKLPKLEAVMPNPKAEELSVNYILLDGDNGAIYDVKEWRNVPYRGGLD